MIAVAPGAPWHALAPEDVERTLATGPQGLSRAEAARRLAESGPNEVESEPEERWWSLVLRTLRDPLVYILLAAAALTLVLRDYTDFAVILAVVAVNSLIGFIQEYRARKAIRGLAKLSAPTAQVLRDGQQEQIASRDLVSGDVVLLTSGSRVPADLRLVQARDLAIDESLLTGESVPVDKTTGALADPDLIAGDQTNVAFSGTTIVRGRGRGIVIRTAAATELGRIAHTVRTLGHVATPLQDVFARFGRTVGVLILALAAVVLIVGLARGMPPLEIFLTAVAMAVAAVPEGLPVILTVTLAVGVRRMARRRAIIRSLPAAETLGSTTVIGTDKTGTLTRNQMTVRQIFAGGVRYDVTGTGYAPDGEILRDGGAIRASDAPPLLATLHTGILASEADPRSLEAGQLTGDPSELALLVAAAKGGLTPSDEHRSHPELDVLPFESERQFMVSLRLADGGPMEHLKGAPEMVLPRCDSEIATSGEQAIDRAAALTVAEGMARSGLRVFAMAYRRAAAERLEHSSLGSGFVFAGLVGMDDPLRPEAAAAVRAAHEAGIRVIMLTGDHTATARAIAERVNLGGRVLSGRDLDRLSEDEMAVVVSEVNAFGRITPDHKLRIVRLLKEQGEVVAVTGDGVNDAPALRAAHLGIAMGASGSDVAREASDMVLADDNFATITAAIEEGRIVFANIRKATFFLLSTAAGEVLAILATLSIGWPLPFTAAQILWINLVTDSLEDLALAFEPGEPDLLKQPPRPRGESVLPGRLIVRLGGVGLVLASVTLAMFWWAYSSTGDMTIARTVAVTQLVVMQFYHTINCRSLDRSIFTISPFSNRYLFLSLLAVTLAHLGALYIPFMQQVLQFAPLSRSQWGLILVLGLLVIVGGEIDKLINRLTRRRLG